MTTIGTPAGDRAPRLAACRSPLALRFLLAIVVIGATLIGMRVGDRLAQAEPPHDAHLTDLTSITQLQARFNADAGQARLILIMSPT